MAGFHGVRLHHCQLGLLGNRNMHFKRYSTVLWRLKCWFSLCVHQCLTEMERQEAMLKITILHKNKFAESNNFVYITWFIYILMQKFFFFSFSYWAYIFSGGWGSRGSTGNDINQSSIKLWKWRGLIWLSTR